MSRLECHSLSALFIDIDRINHLVPFRQAEFHQAANEVLAEAAQVLSSAAMSAESDYMSSR